MRYVAAYMLAVLGGKASPNQNDIEKILSSVGIETDAEKLKKVISELNGKSIDELIAKGISTYSLKYYFVQKLIFFYNQVQVYCDFRQGKIVIYASWWSSCCKCRSSCY